jgi:hypothetical protein
VEKTVASPPWKTLFPTFPSLGGDAIISVENAASNPAVVV